MNTPETTSLYYLLRIQGGRSVPDILLFAPLPKAMIEAAINALHPLRSGPPPRQRQPAFLALKILFPSPTPRAAPV
jgi:hypothetical protein